MVELDNEKTIKRLKEMLLPVMAEAFKEQAETTNYTKYSFEERFTYIVNKEYDSRVNHTIERNIKMSIPLSEVHAIRYRSPHNPLKKSIFFES